MNTQSIYQNIGNFLSESPEWVERWLNAPVKNVINPLMLPEIISNVLKFLPYEDYYRCSGINRTWCKEANFEYDRRMELLKSFSLEDIKIFYSNNPTWTTEANTALHAMRDTQERNYWDTVGEHANANKEYYACFSNPHPGVIGPPIRDTKDYYEKYIELSVKKTEAFRKQVEIEECIMDLNLATISEGCRYLYNIRLMLNNLDPAEVPDSDSSVSDAPADFFEDREWDSFLEEWH